MILRKPYAFFIKYFRVIHLIMAIFMSMLLFQTNSFLTFFNEYLSSNSIAVGRDLVGEIFLKLTYFYIAIVMLMDIVILVLLEFKKKKYLFYVINFFGYVLVLSLYIYINSLLKSLSVQIVDARLLMTIRDLVIISFAFQTASIFITAIRFFGIDIKKFNFENDLKELDVSVTDNEEFEVNVNFDSKKVKRKFRETLRNFKYYFKENVRIILPVIFVIVIIVGYSIYKSITGSTTTYKEGVEFSVPNYRLSILESYVTNKDYQANKIMDNSSLVIVKIKIKTINKTSQFIPGKFALQIGKNKYYHTVKYSSYINDIGDTYIKQKITDTYQTYLLVYEIPNDIKSKKKQLVYVDDISDSIFSRDKKTLVPLNTKDVDKLQSEATIMLNKKQPIESYYFKSFTLKNLEIASILRVNYKKCIEDNCYNFYEPIQANFSGIYDKSILKINYDLEFEDSSIKSNDYYLKQYGRIDYIINNTSKTFYLKNVINLIKVKSKSIYFEIPKEIENATSVDFLFTIRGKTLVYKIK